MRLEKDLIYIVEDDNFYAQLLRFELERENNYEIEVFNSGEQMLKALNTKPDLIILDYNLNSNNPKALNGLQIKKQINRSIPIIGLSNDNRIATGLKFIQSGATDYILKDLHSVKKLGETVNDILKTQKAVNQIKAIKQTRKKEVNRLATISIVLAIIFTLSLYLA